jgi:hypothetical protein
MTFTPEVILPAPADRSTVAMTAQVRSTLIGSSILSLRANGHYDRYVANLDPTMRESIILAPAATWLPIEYAVVHYAACEKLGLGPSEILAMGNAVAELTQKSVFAFATRVAREAGATPLTLVAMTPRLWGRLFVGGGVYAVRTGPKDLRMEFYRATLAENRYWRVGLRGLLTSLLKPFCRQIISRDVAMHDALSVGVQFSWV